MGIWNLAREAISAVDLKLTKNIKNHVFLAFTYRSSLKLIIEFAEKVALFIVTPKEVAVFLPIHFPSN